MSPPTNQPYWLYSVVPPMVLEWTPCRKVGLILDDPVGNACGGARLLTGRTTVRLSHVVTELDMIDECVVCTIACGWRARCRCARPNNRAADLKYRTSRLFSPTLSIPLTTPITYMCILDPISNAEGGIGFFRIVAIGTRTNPARHCAREMIS